MKLKSFAKSILQNLLIVISLSVVMLLVYSAISNFFSDQSYDPIIKELSYDDLALLRTKSQYEEKTNQIIRMEIFNGCGDSGIANRYTKFLMSLGFDIVDNHDADNYNYKKSFIKFHTSNQDMAKEIARVMGISEQNIIEERNPDLAFDISLILGKDYRILDSFHGALYHEEKKMLNEFN